ncbi:MAG: DinB family protein [Acidimicrobiales bacterium]|jgi:hypothetical protein|nr:DinB family protein [Acidimicrobiales bacterium]
MADDRLIEPDTKDWTWVLTRACLDCGFDASAFDARATGAAVRAVAASWQDQLARADVATRPSPTTWSPLEYGCHVRDVLVIGRRRLARMLAEDDPLFDNWDQDRTAVEEDYGAQDPDRVRDELAEVAAQVAELLDHVGDEAWSRPGRRSDGARFTVDSFARYLVHDPVHHLWDVGAAPVVG